MKKLCIGVLLAATAFISTTTNLFPPLGTAVIVNALPSASGATTPSPLNNRFTAGVAIVSAPTNWNFDNGLTGWTTTGTASTTSGGQTGNYLSLSSSGTAISSAFTVNSTGSTFTFYLSGSQYAVMYVATSPYTSWNQVFFGSGPSSGWQAVNVDLSSYAGQSVEVKYRTFGSNGFDDGAGRNQTPDWTPNGAPTWLSSTSVPATTASVGDYSNSETSCTGSAVASSISTGVLLNGSASVLSTNPFTIPADSSRITFQFSTSGSGASATMSLYLSSQNYATAHTLFNKQIGNGYGVYTTCDLTSWAGQLVKVKIASSSGGSISVTNGGEVASFNAGLNEDSDSDPVSPITGLPTIRQTDVAIPGKGVPLDFTRSYAPSGAIAAGNLGWGWTDGYNSRLTISNDGSVMVNYPLGPTGYFKNTSGTLTAPQGNTDSLVKNADNTYTLTASAKVKMNFDTSGKLSSLKDRNGNTTTLAYNGSGFLSSVTDPSGRAFTFTTDTSGRITQISDPLSRTVAYSYDADGNLATVTDVKGGTTTYAYSNHRLTTVTDQLNHVSLTLVYDDADRVVEEKNAVNAVKCTYYGTSPSYTSTNCPGVTPAPAAGETIVVDARGNKTKTQYDTSFRPTGVEDALGNDTTYTYESSGSLCSPANNGNRCSITDPLSHTTSFTYDAARNVLTKTDANNKTSTYTYNSFNDVLTGTDPLNHTTTNAYDSNGNLTSVTNALSQVTTYSPNSDGTLASITDALSHTTSYTYDSYGNRLTQTDPLSHSWTYTYDLGGRKLTETDPLNHTTTYTYDNMDKVLTVTDALSHVTTNVYNAKGLQTSVTDPKSNATTYTYDNADRQSTVTDAASGVTTYAYDANGNRTSVTNPRNKVTTYTYDALNRLSTVTDPLSRVTSFGYDAAGRKTSRTDGKSQQTTYSYDSANRLSGISYPTGTPNASFTFDAAGNTLTMVDGSGTTTLVYDALNRPTSITDGASNVIGYGYDAAGRRTSITYPGTTGSVTYAFDSANRLTSVTDWLSKATSYSYDNANRLTSTTLGNGLISDRTYDNANRLSTVTNRNGGSTISSYSYTLDNVGNRTQTVDTTGTSTFTYDGLYRLTGVTYQNGDAQSYTYDAQGNRLTKVNNGTTTTYTNDNADEMTAAGSTSYSYDNDGNETAAGSDTYGWDAENRMTSSTISGVSDSYTYNGVGLRTSRTIGSSTTSYTWDLTGRVANVLQDSSGNKYVYGLDLISVTDASSSQTYFLRDGLGSTTGLSNGSGTVTGSYTYDVFGATRSQSGTTSEWSFTGQQNDPTGLEYLRARYYDRTSGRFINQDPLPLLQRYAYVADNPVDLTDSSGLINDALVKAALNAAALAGPGPLAATYIAAAIILGDPCWLTHAFCKHVKFAWKEAGKAWNNFLHSECDRAICRGVDSVLNAVGNAELNGIRGVKRFGQLCVAGGFLQCVDRIEMAGAGIATIGFGAGLPLTICLGAGLPDFFTGSAVLCPFAFPAAGAALFGGGTLLQKSAQEWHEDGNHCVGECARIGS